MIYKLHFSNELKEALLHDNENPNNVSGIFNLEKSKIIVFSSSYDKMVAVCMDCGVPWRFIRRNIFIPAEPCIPTMAYYIRLWGFYGNLILTKFDNVQLNLFPDMPSYELKK